MCVISRIFWLAFIVCFVGSTQALEPVPLIAEPRLSHLDTSHGLNQNTINDLQLDKEGFLWIATEEGLSRFDGHKLIEIMGPANELLSNPIYTIMQDSQENFWLGTGLKGVFRFNPNTRQLLQVIDIKMRLDPDWRQYADEIVEDEKGRIYIALNEQVERYDYATQTHQTLFSLSDEQLEAGVAIRTALVHQDVLFVATTFGLYGVDLLSSAVYEINHLPADVPEKDLRLNVKSLAVVDKNSLWVGTVEGLYSLNLGELLKHIYGNWAAPEATTIEALRNIWSISSPSNRQRYLGTDKGIYRVNVDGSKLEFLLQARNGIEDISSKSVRSIVIDYKDNVWFGTQLNGAMFWSPKSTQFINYYNTFYTPPEKRLSDNSVWSMYQESPSTLWVGTNNGLNKIDLPTQEVSQYLINPDDKASYDESTINQIVAIDNRYLWLMSGVKVLKFDRQLGKTVDIDYADEASQRLFDTFAWGIAKGGNHLLWALSEQGIVRFDTLNNEAILIEPQDPNINMALLQNIMGFDAQTSQVLIAASGKLYGMHTETHQFKELHSIINGATSMDMIPLSWLRDSNNNFWLSYSGKGLYQLDASSFAEKQRFSKENYLPTDLVYSLQLAIDGKIWFSSHSGIISFDPSSYSTQNFQYVHGLVATEFNSDANTMLSDGRFAYGSTKGFTIFDPLRLSSNDDYIPSSAKITEVSLASRPLNVPLKVMNDATITLNHDDLGLSVYFSSLNYEMMTTDRFQYRLTSNNSDIHFPMTYAHFIELPSLAPGEHKLSLLTVDKNNIEPEAELTILVKYPPFLSPFAYLMYAILGFVIISFYLYRRVQVQRSLALASQRLEIINKRLTSALRASNSDIWEWRSSSNQMMSSRYAKALGYTEHPKRVSFEIHVSLIHENDRLQYLSAWRSFIRGAQEQFDITYRMKTKAGDYLWFRDAGSSSYIPLKRYTLVTGTYTNITDTVASQERLKVFGDAFEHTRDWVLIFDKNRVPYAANPAFLRAFNIDENADFSKQVLNVFERQSDVRQRLLSRLYSMHPQERWKSEIALDIRGKQLTTLTDVNCIVNDSDANDVEHYLVIMTDITEQKNAQIELQKLASFDVLTGLINRTLLLERLKQSIAFARRHSTGLAVFFIDLDRFKPINDTYGHELGDKVLVEISKRIQASFRDEDAVSRLGGDEFVVILEEISDIEVINKIVALLLLEIEKPIIIDGQHLSVSASVGISLYPQDAADAEQLLRNADVAMYSAKEGGKNRFKHFTASMNDRVEHEMLLQNKVKAAVKKKAFVNYYQPIIDTHTGNTAGFEMLLRWEHQGEHISPSVFVPIAEQLGLIVSLTMQRLEQTIEDIALWYAKGFTGYVAVNLSAHHFATRPAFEHILSLLEARSLPSACLCFEITESLLINNTTHTLEYMCEMRDLGFKISLDDFGTGYSSLKYLKDFPIDVVKIDKSFVDDVSLDKGTESIIKSTLIMNKMLKLDTVAEGVETQAQVDYFMGSECQYLQGYFFSKAVRASEVPGLIDTKWC